jgi:hypothetical protein
MTEATFPIASRKRQVGFYITVGLFSLLLIAFTGFMIPVLPSVIIGWFNPDLFGIHQLHEMNGGGCNKLAAPSWHAAATPPSGTQSRRFANG